MGTPETSLGMTQDKNRSNRPHKGSSKTTFMPGIDQPAY